MSDLDGTHIGASTLIGMYLEMVTTGEMTLEEFWHATDPFKHPDIGEYLRAALRERCLIGDGENEDEA